MYIVVYGGVKDAGLGAHGEPTVSGAMCFAYDARLRLLCRFSPCECEVGTINRGGLTDRPALCLEY